MSTRSAWLHDPVQIVAQIYDGCAWRGSTTKHNAGLQVFWRKAWSVAYDRALQINTPIPGSLGWEGEMLLTHRDEIQAYRRMTRTALKAMAYMMKDDYPEPLFCIVVALCMTRLKDQ